MFKEIKKETEIPVQWEHRLNKFDPIKVGQDKINYWVREGNKLLVGFHGLRETYGETEIGEFLGDPERNESALFLKDKENSAIIEKVLPIILEGLGDIEIVKESQIPKKVN